MDYNRTDNPKGIAQSASGAADFAAFAFALAILPFGDGFEMGVTRRVPT
jgi:hypothetical protein